MNNHVFPIMGMSGKPRIAVSLKEGLEVEGIVDTALSLLKNHTNPTGMFHHPITKRHMTLSFMDHEGRDTMLHQALIGEIMLAFQKRKNVPKFVTVDTQSTIPLEEGFSRYITGIFDNWDDDLKSSFYMNDLVSICAENFTYPSQDTVDIMGVEWKWRLTINDDTDCYTLHRYLQASKYVEIIYVWNPDEDELQMEHIAVMASLPGNDFAVTIQTTMETIHEATKASYRYGYDIQLVA